MNNVFEDWVYTIHWIYIRLLTYFLFFSSSIFPYSLLRHLNSYMIFPSYSSTAGHIFSVLLAIFILCDQIKQQHYEVDILVLYIFVLLVDILLSLLFFYIFLCCLKSHLKTLVKFDIPMLDIRFFLYIYMLGVHREFEYLIFFPYRSFL